MVPKNILQEKAQDYILCFVDNCPLHQHCLRWLAGQHAPADRLVKLCVNPRNGLVGTAECPLHRDNKVVRVAVGMTQFFHDMPHHTALGIKSELFALFTRTRFYKLRRGDMPITREMQRQIAAVCHRHGWTAKPRYDRYEDQYLWE